MGFRRAPQHESCRKISHKLRPSDMETISEVVYWAVLLYTPIYWFIGMIVLGGCFIAGTIWSTLACSFDLKLRDVQKIRRLGCPVLARGESVTHGPCNRFILLVHRSQTGGDLRRDFERQLHLEPTGAFDEFFERFPLNKLHRVEVIPARSAQVEDRGNIRVTDAGRCACFTQKAKPCRFVVEISCADDLQRHRTVKVHVERFVRDTHRTATQLDRFPIFAGHHLVVLKSLRRPFRCRVDRLAC